MTPKDLAYRLEALMYQAEKIHSLQEAISVALYNGHNHKSDYEWAFALLGELTSSTRDGLKEVTGVGFDLMRAQEANGTTGIS